MIYSRHRLSEGKNASHLQNETFQNRNIIKMANLPDIGIVQKSGTELNATLELALEWFTKSIMETGGKQWKKKWPKAPC